MNAKVISYIGLCLKSGNAVFGEDMILERRRTVKLVLVDSAASDKYKTRLKTRINFAPVIEVDKLATAVHRDNVLSLGATSEELASAIIKELHS